MIASAGMPAHHRDWPRKCPKCKRLADGFQIVVPIEGKINPETGKWQEQAWGLNGMACIRCQWICVPLALDDAPDFVNQNYIGSLIYRAPWFQGIQAVEWMREKKYNKKCCLPPEPGSESKAPQ